MLKSSLWNVIRSEKYFNFLFSSSCSPAAAISIFWHHRVSLIYWNLISSRAAATRQLLVQSCFCWFIIIYTMSLSSSSGCTISSHCYSMQREWKEGEVECRISFYSLDVHFLAFNLYLYTLCRRVRLCWRNPYIRYPWMHECDSLLLSLSSSTRIMKFLIQIPSR